MSTINGKTYSETRNINLNGGALGTGLLRWTPPVSGVPALWSSNPFTTTDYGLYINAAGALTFSALGVAQPLFKAVETIAAGGTTTALSLTKSAHLIDADAGGDIFTLAAGAEGQIVTIAQLSSTGTSTITPVVLAGGTSITFNAAGDAVTLQYLGAKWYIIGGNSYAII